MICTFLPSLLMCRDWYLNFVSKMICHVYDLALRDLKINATPLALKGHVYPSYTTSKRLTSLDMKIYQNLSF